MITPDDIELTGKTALVTGAARGIGRAVALSLAAFGADLALCDRDEEPLTAVATEAEALGRRVRTAVLDVRDPEAVTAFVGGLGELDIVVNNAGGTYHARFADSAPKGDETLVRENLLSSAWVTRAALPRLRDGGSIVNITSIEAARGAPGYALYAAAKAGLESLTRTLALELGDRRIRVNAVAPDVIPTPGIGPIDEPATPLAVSADPDDVAGVVLFLASRLGRFVTGVTIAVDGGNAAAGGWRRDASGGWAP